MHIYNFKTYMLAQNKRHAFYSDRSEHLCEFKWSICSTSTTQNMSSPKKQYFLASFNLAGLYSTPQAGTNHA